MLENYEKKINEIFIFFEYNFGFKFQNKKNIIDLIFQNTNFNKLKEIENNKGFIEEHYNNFFRSGKKDTWKDILSTKQIKRIELEFKKTMKIYDYL